MAQADQLDLLKLLLEVNYVKNPGRVCQQLHVHGVTTLTQFAELSVEMLVLWGIATYSYHDRVSYYAHSLAQRLLRDSSHDFAAIRQQLLVRARLHYMYVTQARSRGGSRGFGRTPHCFNLVKF